MVVVSQRQTPERDFEPLHYVTVDISCLAKLEAKGSQIKLPLSGVGRKQPKL